MLQRHPPDFIFETVGSHGDVMPLLGVAAELTRRGHRCQLLANEHFRDEASARGIEFYGTIRERTHHEVPLRPFEYVYYTFEGVHQYFREPASFHRETLVVNTHVFASSEPLAEAHGLRTARLTLFPVRIKSLLAPPWPLGALASGPDGEHFLKVVLPQMHRTADEHPEMLAKINSVRARVGLGPVRQVTREGDHVIARGALFPEWFGMPAADWPAMPFFGFPLPGPTKPLPTRVREFLDEHPRPLVFTTGTSFSKPEPFFAAAVDCCERLGMPGILLSPFAKTNGRLSNGKVAHFDFVELEALLPHVALLSHHGGMGTTARALEAGIPQIVSPMGFDQPDNGHRVEVLRAGRVVPRAGLSGGALAAAARELLDNQEVQMKLSQYRRALHGGCGLRRTADHLENVRRESVLPPCNSSPAPAWPQTATTQAQFISRAPSAVCANVHRTTRSQESNNHERNSQ
jgi:rhamnosyltransferase subunit B